MDAELNSLEISIYIVTSLSFLISILLLAHLLVFKSKKYKDKLKVNLTKFVLWLIFCGLMKNIFGLANFGLTNFITCTILISIIRFFAMAEQLFSFMIALELFLQSTRPLNEDLMRMNYYRYALSIIFLLSIITGIMNGVDYYAPGSACLQQNNALYAEICEIFFLIVFLVNMLLFMAFFIKSRKLIAQAAESQISKKEEVKFYFLIFLTLGLLRAPYYVEIFFDIGIVDFLVVILVNTCSAFLVPLIFSWNYELFNDYRDWVKRCCNSSNSSIPENLTKTVD